MNSLLKKCLLIFLYLMVIAILNNCSVTSTTSYMTSLSTSKGSHRLSKPVRAINQPQKSLKNCWKIVDKKKTSNQKDIFILATGFNLDGLQYANKDAKEFEAVMQQLFEGTPNSVHTCLLTHSEPSNNADFVKALEELSDKNRVDANDLVIIFYSGHGNQEDDINGDETDDHKDEYFVTSNNPDSEITLLDDYFVRLVNAIPTNNILTVIDACFAAGFDRAPESVINEQVKNPGTKLSQRYQNFVKTKKYARQNLTFESIKGVFFSATDKKRPAYELKGSCNGKPDKYIGGRFTVFWRETLTAAIQNKKQKAINLLDVFKETKNRVYAHSKQCSSDDVQIPKAKVDYDIMPRINSYIPF